MTELDNLEIYRSVLEDLPIGLYLVDRYRRIVFWNSGAERICGYLRQDVVGRFLREHLHATEDPADAPDAEDHDPISLVLRDGKPSTAHVSILHKEGYRVPVVLQTVPLRNEHGAIIGAAECFESNVAATERTRRRTASGRPVCLDEVTGFPSKGSMEAHLRELLAVFMERHADFAIVMIAIDCLDDLRASRGPGIVPSILRVVSHTIANSLRPTDDVGAWSNNRFLAVLTECKEGDLERVAKRLRKMIGQSQVEWWGDRFAVTASLGCAGCRPEDTVESLVDRTEKAFEESAAAGGNRVTVGR